MKQCYILLAASQKILAAELQCALKIVWYSSFIRIRNPFYVSNMHLSNVYIRECSHYVCYLPNSVLLVPRLEYIYMCRFDLSLFYVTPLIYSLILHTCYIYLFALYIYIYIYMSWMKLIYITVDISGLFSYLRFAQFRYSFISSFKSMFFKTYIIRFMFVFMYILFQHSFFYSRRSSW